MSMRKLLVISVLLACGGKPPAPTVPMLPGDGDSHVVKPPPPKTVAASDPWSARNDLIAPPTPVSPAAIALPKIEEIKLANGLTVYAIKNDRLPVVSVQLAVRAGRMHEPRARLGVSGLTADMLVQGTQRRDFAAIRKAVDFVGGTLRAEATYEATMLSCSVLARSLTTCLELLPELVSQPAFPATALPRLRELAVADMRQRLDDASLVATAHASNLLWGNEHVRGWVGDEATLAAISREDLVAWHRAWFVPGNALLVITGDFDPKRLRGDLERTFGAWRKGPVPPAPTYGEPGLSGSRIRLIDKPGLAQTHIRIAQFGIKHDDARFFDTLVWNYALGGGGTASRLTRGLRLDTNKAYGASSTFDRNLDRGAFLASSITRNADAVIAAKRMLAEIAKLAAEGPTPDEVAAAIANLTGGYGLRFQSVTDFGAAVIGAELHGFGQQYLANFPVAVGAVTVEDAKKAAATILDPKAYVMVLVGDAKDLEPLLKKEGWRYEKIAFTDPINPPVKHVEGPVDPKAAAAGAKLIDEALAAKGGKATLAAVKAISIVATGATLMQSQTMPVQISRTLVLPDKMRIDATFKPPGAPKEVTVSVAIAGTKGWQRGNDPKTNEVVVADVTGAGLATADFERWREPELILLKATEPAAKTALVGDETIGGNAYSVVKVRSPFTDVDVLLYIDKKTKLIGRMSYRDSGSTEVDDFLDYRTVGGIKVAHKRTSTGAGRSTTLEIKSIDFAPKIDPAMFDKPAAK